MNRDACEGRLRTMVTQAAVRPKVRRRTKPTRGSIERRLEGKRQASERKRDRRWRDDG
jgi:ribosome-associated protein